MKSTATVTGVSRNFADFINRVAYRGEEFVLVRGQKPVAELRPAPRGRKLGELSELMRSVPSLAAGDLDSFARDLSDLREETAADQTVSFGPGDYVVFPQGLDCTWKVKKTIRKHYKFG